MRVVVAVVALGFEVGNESKAELEGRDPSKFEALQGCCHRKHSPAPYL